MSGKDPHPVDALVGRHVRMSRLLKNMSQEALADRLGITFQQVQKYQNAANRISASRLQQIADILIVPVGHLFEGETSRLPPDWMDDNGKINDFLATREGLALIDAFMKIDDRETRRRLLELVQAIAAGMSVNP